MTDTVSSPAALATSPVAKKASPIKKKTAAGAAKAKKTTAAHPSTSIMVTSAIKGLNEKKGSSLPAIKKYLAANYKVDPAKLAPFIRKFLKASVASGAVVQTKGTGASGHFKLAAVENKPKKVAAKKKVPVAKKAKAPGTPKKKPAAKKAKATGEPAAKKAKKVTVTSKSKKTPTKAKKPAAAKPKATKPKKTTAKKVAAPKKK